MAFRFDAQRNRYVRSCENLPDHTAQAVPDRHDHEFFLRRDLATRAPKEAVVWAVWMGGFAELRTWPWTADGLAQAQAWCDEHDALWMREGYPVRPGSLAAHADAV